MRLFIAAELPLPIKRQLVETKQHISRGVKGVKWVEDKNLHLTLKFLGEVEESMLPRIIDQTQNAVRGIQTIKLSLSVIGYFPDINNPRVIWAGLKGEIDKINMIGIQLDSQLQSLGFEKEKNRKAHLTLGRVKSNDGLKQLFININNIKYPAMSDFILNEIVLFQSHLTREGPIYSALEKFGFDG